MYTPDRFRVYVVMFGGGNHHFMTLVVIFLYIFNQSGIHSLAFLYTDPGSGALVWQLLVASFVGGLFYLRSFIRRITAKMSGRRSREESDRQSAIDRAGTTTPNRNNIQ
jgi:hypothetical protein